MVIVSRRGGLLEELLKKIEEFVSKQAEGDKKTQAADFVKQAKEVLGSKDPDLRKVLELLGKVLELFKDKMPEELKGVMEAYGQAVQSCIDLLNVTPVSPFERAVRKAYDETGNIDDAIKLALKLFPETTAAEVEAARKLLQNIIKARELKRLKDSHPAPKSGWGRFWHWLNSLISASPRRERVTAPVLVLTATLVLGVGLLSYKQTLSSAGIDAAPSAQGAGRSTQGGLPATHRGSIPSAPEPAEDVKPPRRHDEPLTNAVISSRDVPKICGTPGCGAGQHEAPSAGQSAAGSNIVPMPSQPVQVPPHVQPTPPIPPTHK